jgi:putative membrane protein
MRLLGRLGILALAFWVATAFLSGIKVNGGFWTYLWVALLFGLINTFIGSLLKLLTLPAVLLTFGLFSFIINAAMLMLTSRWSSALDVKNFGYALVASLIISIVSSILNKLFIKRSMF